MYTVNVKIKGITALLQHRFTIGILDDLMKGSTRSTGAKDYSLEWLDTMFSKDGYIYQPANHIEGSLVKAAGSFKIKGRGTKTWKDPIKAYCYVGPEEIPHIWKGEIVKEPDASLLLKPTENLSVSIMRAKVNGAAIPRMRLMLSPGWELVFSIEVHDEQVQPEVLEEILREAGRAVGISDYRPRYGRFEVVDFQKQ